MFLAPVTAVGALLGVIPKRVAAQKILPSGVPCSRCHLINVIEIAVDLHCRQTVLNGSESFLVYLLWRKE